MIFLQIMGAIATGACAWYLGLTLIMAVLSKAAPRLLRLENFGVLVGISTVWAIVAIVLIFVLMPFLCGV